MRQHLLRTRHIEQSIQSDLLKLGSVNWTSAERVLVDLIDIRIKVLDRLIEQEPTSTLSSTYQGRDIDEELANLKTATHHDGICHVSMATINWAVDLINDLRKNCG